MAAARPSNPVLSPGSDFVQSFCSKVESYQQGSNHYFLCLESGQRLIAQGVTGQQLIDELCSELADLFYDESSVSRCYRDGNALLGE
jgi:hypothetical protein